MGKSTQEEKTPFKPQQKNIQKVEFPVRGR